MAALTVQSIALTGLDPTYTAVAAAGDTFVNNGRTFIHVLNANVGAARTVTIDSLVACNQGSDHNIAVSVTASGEKMIGPFPTDRFNSSAGAASITYSDSGADLTIAAITI